MKHLVVVFVSLLAGAILVWTLSVGNLIYLATVVNLFAVLPLLYLSARPR